MHTCKVTVLRHRVLLNGDRWDPLGKGQFKFNCSWAGEISILVFIFIPVWKAKRPGRGSDPPSREGGVVLVTALLLYRHPWEE